ncbi:MAG: response regulator [Miltoncostaeaceae bacterium]
MGLAPYRQRSGADLVAISPCYEFYRHMVNVLLVEDNALLRSSLGIALGQHGVRVVASCADVSEAVEHLSNGTVHALVTDLDLGHGPNGIALAHAARTANPDVGVVLLTAYSDPRLVGGKLLQIPPGTEYVVKSDVNDVMVVRHAIDRAIQRAQPGARQIAAQAAADHGLTDVQIETMRMVAEGLTNAEIAERRVVAVKSVEHLIARIAKQLDITNDASRNQRVMITREYYRLIGAQGGPEAR